jgi:hypothetical protein
MTLTLEAKRASNREAQRRYYATHKDVVSKRNSLRRAANLEAAREKERAYRATTRARRLELQRAWHAANRERVVARRVLFNNDPDTWVARVIYAAKSRCKRLGIQFDLRAEDVQIPEQCPFTLLPFHWGPKNRKVHPQSPSLDRIKPHLGYVRGNVRVISNHANTIKSNCIDPDVFQRLADDARLWSLI